MAVKEHCITNNLNPIEFRPKEGESPSDMCERANEFTQYLKNNFKDKSVLICGHSAFFVCLELAIKGESIKDYYKSKALENGELKEIAYN